MKKLVTSDKIYISQSKRPKAGRGVFAGVDIKKGELIERCPVIDVPKYDVSSLRESILVTYFYYFGKIKERLVIALGFGSIYNHSYEPNAIYNENHKERVMDFAALKTIKKDEEITVNYSSGNLKNKNPLWFKVAVPPKINKF